MGKTIRANVPNKTSSPVFEEQAKHPRHGGRMKDKRQKRAGNPKRDAYNEFWSDPCWSDPEDNFNG